MIEVRVSISGNTYIADMGGGVSLSIPLRTDGVGPNCFYAPLFEATPLVAGDFIGSVASGSPVNFLNVRLNPHGNGTHTESIGHISDVDAPIHKVCPKGLLTTLVVSVYPKRLENGDRVIDESILDDITNVHVDALIIRTLPNSKDKLIRGYSGTNPPYLLPSTITAIVNSGVNHLLLDLPSVDREEDGGQLLSHKAFWEYPTNVNKARTITEMVYVPDSVQDGLCVCTISVPPFMIDAAPSSVIVYPIVPVPV